MDALKFFNGDQLAADVWLSKYALKDDKGNVLEKSPEDTIDRMATEFARAENKYKGNEYSMAGLSDFGRSLPSALDKSFIKTYFDKFKYIVPQGSILAMLGNPYAVGSLSNCFVIPYPSDSYGGILKTDQELVQLMKRRGGVGTGLHSLRPVKSRVKNAAGSSTGVPAFMQRYSNSTREVAQDGRRGALMLLLHCLHPDIFDFVKSKKDRTKVTGANISCMLTDKFMKAAEANEDFFCRFPIDADISKFDDLSQILVHYNEIVQCSIGDFSCQIMKIHARELFDLIVEMAWENGEPGVAFIDRILNYCPEGMYEQFKPIASNPCVSGDTLLLTDKGYYSIESLCGKSIKIWNGEEWSEVSPEITGENQEMLSVTLSDGREIKCTPYHSWFIKGKGKTEAKDLSLTDKVEKYKLPIVEYGEKISTKIAYSQGFYSGDGSRNSNHIWLYNNKIDLHKYLSGNLMGGVYGASTSVKQVFKLDFKNHNKEFVPINNWSISSRLDWIAGLIDSDGNSCKDGSLQITSVNKNFLSDVQLLFTTLGVNSKVVSEKREEERRLPNGKGGHSLYKCQKAYRVLVPAVQMQQLLKMGLKTHRVSFEKFSPNRDASRFITIKSINKIENAKYVYCFNEKKNHKGIFNGLLLGNCGEQWLDAYNSCRLIALNLFGIVRKPFTPRASIDYKKLYEIAYIQQRLADDIVDLEIEYVDRIIEKVKKDPESKEVKAVELNLWTKVRKAAEDSRRTGCGFTGLGDMLAAVSVKYDSDEAFEIVTAVMKTKLRAELDCTIDMAIQRGTFNGWDVSKEYDVICGTQSPFKNPKGLMASSMKEGYEVLPKNDFYKMLWEEFPEQVKAMLNYGRRNVSWSTVAPTGTVSIMTQTTSGLEPLFLAYYMRRKKVNPSDEGNRIDFVDQSGDSWTEYAVLHPKFQDWLRSVMGNELDEITLDKATLEQWFEVSPWCGSCANDIDWGKRIDIQAIIQRYTTNAISATVNLPKDVDKNVIKDIYLRSWKADLKGVTVYRDGSRTGVLISESEKKAQFGYRDAIKRPKELEAELCTVSVKGLKYGVIIGLFEGMPYEVFAFPLPEEVKHSNKGKLIKVKKGHYDFISEDGALRNVQAAAIRNDEQVLTRLLSGMLRHGAKPQFAIEQIDKCELEVVSFGKAISRVLKRFVKEEDLVGREKCGNCQSTNIRREEGCKRCIDCGHSAC